MMRRVALVVYRLIATAVDRIVRWTGVDRVLSLITPPAPPNRHAVWSVVFDGQLDSDRRLVRSLLLQLGGKIEPPELASDYATRLSEGQRTLLGRWPGEHYALLYWLSIVAEAKRVVEIGTHEGLSALMFVAGGAERCDTFDVVPWTEFPESVLRHGDFDSGVVVQHLADLKDPEVRKKFASTFQQADLVLVDGPKDGDFEYRVVPWVLGECKPGALVIVDDIRFANMVALWASLELPKADLTSFGHWSGTGVVAVPDTSHRWV